MEWINPHTWIHIDVKEPDGNDGPLDDRGRHAEHAPPAGLTKNSLPQGTEIVVDGYKAKNGSNRANGRDITFPDGRKLFLGSSGTGAPRDGRDSSEK